MQFIYLHGFNSDGEGWKAEALRRQFPGATVWAPDLPAAPRQVIAMLKDYLLTSEAQTILVGSSLGGFYAYWASACFSLQALLFNPSLSPHQTLDKRGVGHFKTWTKGREYHFKRAYLVDLEELQKMAHPLIQQKLLYFFLATDDNVLDHRTIPEQYPRAEIHWYQNTGHGFSKFEKALKQMKKNDLG